MSATHVLRVPAGLTEGFPVRAWFYDPAKSIPAWVARKFHQLGTDRKQTAVGPEGCLITVRPGEWVVDLGGVMVVLPDVEFQRQFEPAAAGGEL